MSRISPTLELEASLLEEGFSRVVLLDEVGRGALAGPVAVGVVVLGADVVTAGAVPAGLADSKLLSARVREGLVSPLTAWVDTSGVGMASAAEIDEMGIMRALRLAAERGLEEAGVVLTSTDAVVVDGNFNWVERPEPAVGAPNVGVAGTVRTIVKADARCAGVAAASVLAKVARDALLAGLAATHPMYGWERNAGYASAMHREAIRQHGACELHRRSWRLV
jgi:ribonuclease HII